MIEITRDEEISRLAWAAKIAQSQGVRAVVGPWVEIGPDYLFEGCWNGDLEKADFANSYSFMGSGIRVDGDNITIVAPCNTTEAVYTLYTSSSEIWTSNSIALLLKVSSTELDPNYLDYEAAFLSIANGLHAYQKTVPIILSDGRKSELSIHYFCNIIVNSDNTLSPSAKPGCSPINRFTDYEQFLNDEMQGLVLNANDARRKQSYPPVVFCSTGYDSTLCAVIGANAGCDDAVCFESKKTGAADSGEEIVRSLGYANIHVKKRK